MCYNVSVINQSHFILNKEHNTMANNPDAYLLYEYMDKVCYTVRAKIRLSETIDEKLLNEAAQEALTRLPYFSVKAVLDNGGNYMIQHNDAPMPVIPENPDKKLILGSEKLNRHLFVITYHGDTVWFSFSHSICGGFGLMFWVKTTLYLYLSKKYGEIEKPNEIKLPGTPVDPEELFLPDADSIPDDKPLTRYNGGSTNIGITRFLKYLINPFAQNNYFFQLTIPADKFMDYARKIDGSPNTVLSALFFKSCVDYFKEKKDTHLSVRIADDYRNDIGAEKSYRDFVRLLHIRYDWNMRGETIEKLNMRARGAILGQSQPELSYERYKNLEKVHKGIDEQPDLKSKKKYAGANSTFRNDTRDTFTISYTKPVDWGGMSQYIKDFFLITDGDLMLEVIALKDKFCIAFQLINKDKKPFELFCKLLEQENIPYEASVQQKRMLPKIELP